MTLRQQLLKSNIIRPEYIKGTIQFGNHAFIIIIPVGTFGDPSKYVYFLLSGVKDIIYIHIYALYKYIFSTSILTLMLLKVE